MRLRKLFRSKVLIFALVILAGGGFGYRYFANRGKSPASFITVTRGSIAQEVIITGNTKPAEKTDLAFEKSGKISKVRVDVGDAVTANQPLVELDQSDLQTQLLQAKANADAAQAKLDELVRGPRPEDIQVSRTSLLKAQQDLANDYNGTPDTLQTAYSQADDAVRKQIAPLYVNAEQTNVQLSFTVSDSQAALDAATLRMQASAELNTWKNELYLLSATSSQNNLDNALQNAVTHLTAVRKLLDRTMDVMVGPTSLDATTLLTYKSYVTTARTNVNASLTNVNNQIQAVAAQKIAIQQAEDQLNLKLAGSDPQEIASQRALVEQADANVDNIKVQLAKTVLRSPIDGIVTRQDAKMGQIAAANTALVSVISRGQLEIDANIPEVDIGKVSVGNPVRITLDAFPGESFMGKVQHIDPAETIIDGVVNFKVTVLFDIADPRFKSGLTANLAIQTLRKDNALTLPQVAILQNDEGIFVEKADGENTVQVPVTIGIRSQDGSVEILSGVREGERVLNIGSKSSAGK